MKKKIFQRWCGRTDTVTCFSFSPDECYILCNAMDKTLIIWKLRLYVPEKRCEKIFNGLQHSFENN